MVDRYVFGLSTKHPVVSVNELTRDRVFSPCPRGFNVFLFLVLPLFYNNFRPRGVSRACARMHLVRARSPTITRTS